MSSTETLWLQVQERLAAQAWSLTDDTWFTDGAPSHAARALSAWGHTDPTQRLGTAQALQAASDARAFPDGDISTSIVRAWCDLRVIDYELERNFTDLRSDIAAFVANAALDRLSTCATTPYRLVVTGPGVTRDVLLGTGSTVGEVRLPWPVLIEYICDLQLPDFVDVDMTVPDDSAESVRHCLTSLHEVVTAP